MIVADTTMKPLVNIQLNKHSTYDHDTNNANHTTLSYLDVT